MLLNDKLQYFEIILASASPRRRELIAGAGIKFTQAPSYEVEEIYPEDLLPAQIPVYLSELKSAAYPGILSEANILITADTVVCINDKVIGKPTDRLDAISILSALSGQKHHVITGVTLRSRDKKMSFAENSVVHFRHLSAEEIEYYVDNYRPYDKAGAYGIQEWIGYVGITGIEGSFYNVMGMPIQRLYVALDEFIG